MKKIENETRRAVDAGETVVYNSIPIYKGEDEIPSGVTIIATGDKGFQKSVTIKNAPK